MSEDPAIQLPALRAEGAKIYIALISATPDTVVSICDEACAWVPRLLEAVEPFGPREATLFETLTPMEREETECMRNVPWLNNYHFETMRDHATRMYRLKKLCEKLPGTMPKGKSGPKRIEHTEAIRTARELRQTGAADSNREAAEMAVEKHGRGPHNSNRAAIDAVRKAI